MYSIKCHHSSETVITDCTVKTTSTCTCTCAHVTTCMCTCAVGLLYGSVLLLRYHPNLVCVLFQFSYPYMFSFFFANEFIIPCKY